MSYETNLSDARWHIIAEFIEDGRKRKHSLRTIVDAMLYVVKTGCQWRYLPLNFPKWQLIYYYFRKAGSQRFTGNSARRTTRSGAREESVGRSGI
jgi:transposase